MTVISGFAGLLNDLNDITSIGSRIIIIQQRYDLLVLLFLTSRRVRRTHKNQTGDLLPGHVNGKSCSKYINNNHVNRYAHTDYQVPGNLAYKFAVRCYFCADVQEEYIYFLNNKTVHAEWRFAGDFDEFERTNI